MKRPHTHVFVSACLLIAMLAIPGTGGADKENKVVPDGLRRLVRAYPTKLCGAETNTLVWCDGTRMIYDDGKKKSFEERLEKPDLEDQMSMKYPRTWSPPAPINSDPGRVRFEPFFKKMYGSSAREVQTKLDTIIWLPGVADKKIRVTSTGGVLEKLKSVSAAILGLDRSIVDKVKKVSGAFAWRKIAGTRRLSSHSYGIAIDVGVEHADYWRWSRPGAGGLRYTNRFPLEVVEIFENHGFIWGGKWYHFDSMHFEYRPELILLP
ncbi:MAG: M15 family metallopeptidase [Deltaproteobacteria bacterium]|nr:M15 family metallopeptidase [Deltaproteobacteria bacterium]